MIVRVEKHRSTKITTQIDIFNDSIYVVSLHFYMNRSNKEIEYFRISKEYEYKRKDIYGARLKVTAEDLWKYIKRKNELYHYLNRPLLINEEELSKFIREVISKYPLKPWYSLKPWIWLNEYNNNTEEIQYDPDLLYRFNSLISC